MAKKIFYLMAIFIFSFSVTFAAAKPDTNNSEKNFNASVYDNAKILSANQIKTLSEKISAVEQKHKIKLGANFFKNLGSQNIDTVANERLRKYFGGAINGGIILVVDVENRKWNIALDEKIKEKILNYNTIAHYNENFYNNLHNDDFFGAANAYIQNVDELLNYYETNGTRYDPAEKFDPFSLGIGILIAIVLGFGVREWLISSMSNVKFAIAATDYLKQNTVNITESRDTYLYTNISRRPKSRNSNGGGRNSGGGSSGGGSF